MAIQMMEKSLCKRRNGRSYLQFNNVCQLRAAVSDVYSATSTAHKSRYSLNSHRVSVMHMYKGSMQSESMENLLRARRGGSQRTKIVINPWIPWWSIIS